jgi:Domain of unknown function (DUF1707)
MSDPSSLRVADTDRERLGEELREHMVAGRLTQDELEERLGLAYQAKTQADLDALRADLPMSPAVLERSLRARRSKLRRRLLQEGGASLSASAVCVAIWIAAGASGSFWPAWVILFTLLPLLRDGWQLFGPIPDERTVARLEARNGRRAHGRHHRSQHRSLPR